MVSFNQAEWPMGCATSGDPSLKQMGLAGNHAYSILDCREVQTPNSNGNLLSVVTTSSSLYMYTLLNPNSDAELV